MTEGAQYRVRLEVFEGPLDLLLTLIQRESLDITTVALAQVTDQYLRYMAALEEIDAGALAEFCQVAATLIVIKSRALLPTTTVAADEEEDSEAQELAERLRAYRRLRQAAEGLGHRERGGLRAYVRTAPPPDVKPTLDPGDVTVTDLARAFETALAEAARQAEPPPVRGVRAHPVRLADRLASIRDLLAAKGRVAFREALLGERRDREFVIVSFLAVLELLRRRYVHCVQAELFGEIMLEKRPDAGGWLETEGEFGAETDVAT